jgi:2-dehydropantoate 2-reductase
MRILVVGAGATGGYFGGRLLQAGKEVTFLVRPARAARLKATGLVIGSEHGDVALPSPPTVLQSELRAPYDVILLSCKSYDLAGAIDAFAPAVGPDTAIVPLLNGMRHLDVLDDRFGAGRVLGGLCIISARLDADGRIVHLNDMHALVFGARAEAQRPGVEAAASALAGAAFEARVSEDIVLEMWEKWVALATLAGITCLARAAVGDVAAAGGADLISSLFQECRAIAAAAGRLPRPAFNSRVLGRFTDPSSPLIASMLGDLERGGSTEADHILGDLLRRRFEPPAPDHSLLRIAYACVKAAEVRQRRAAAAGRPAPE